MSIAAFVAGLALGLMLMHLAQLRGRRRPAAAPATAPPALEAPASPVQATESSSRDRLFELKRLIDAQDERIQRPQHLHALPEFREAAALMASPELARSEWLSHLGSEGYILGCAAAAALPEREDVDPEWLLGAMPQLGGYVLHFVLDYLQTRADAASLPALLLHARDYWWDYAPFRSRFREYLQWAARHAPGRFEDNRLDEIDETALAAIEAVLEKFREPALADPLAQIAAARVRHREKRVLGGFGRIAGAATAPTLHAALRTLQTQTCEKLLAGRSIVATGEHGVGKTAMVDAVVARLREGGWLVFEASAADILSDQKYIGELEGRVKEMLSLLNRPKALWRTHDLLDLVLKGATTQDPRGILDLVLPALERGQLLMIAEAPPRGLTQALLARPALRRHLDIVPVTAPDAEALQALAMTWAQEKADLLGQPVADAATLAEAARMVAQYFPDTQEPGRLLRVLADALQHSLERTPPTLPLSRETLLAAIAGRSGVPLDILDDDRPLDLAGVRAFFSARVLGQDEAVERLVDRIAMLKAGLLDPGRPIGVFLFAGPTGTGKTELAKALGELLFGGADRLLRLDMSEYASEDSAWRLIAEDDARGGVRSLTARIREQPFSVVLLDEFEKAHPKIWDLFLQVFDDGRLTDRGGNTVDFRHALIILTSNVGSTLSRGTGPGFVARAGEYSRGMVEKAVYETFRREFLNRLDHIVLFKPLDRTLMRGILHKELDRALTRRGLRNRDWAVEWEPSAIEFLLDRGFTPDLGARPLRRAIEQYLLAPLSRSIVEQRTPQGDQFLFVSSEGDHLEVRFIDPDAPAAEPGPQADPGETPDLRRLAARAGEFADASRHLREHHARMLARAAGAAWVEAREGDYARMADAGFWASPERFEVLDRIERRDRVESALASTGRLVERLATTTRAEHAERLAQGLFLADMAMDDLEEQRPQDALVEIFAGDGERMRDAVATRSWWRTLLAMYVSWAERRNLRIEVLAQDADRPYAWLAITGFGALRTLEAESGLHVLEYEQDGETTSRLPLHVVVRPDRPGHRRHAPAAVADGQRVVRRYRQSPSALVRDSIRGWRTGRLDRVLAGDFDLID